MVYEYGFRYDSSGFYGDGSGFPRYRSANKLRHLFYNRPLQSWVLSNRFTTELAYVCCMLYVHTHTRAAHIHIHTHTYIHTQLSIYIVAV